MKKKLLIVAFIIAMITAFAVSAAATNFCAVGEVKDGKAAILTDDGTVKTVKFTGTAPESDKIYTFAVDGDVYTFTLVPFYIYQGQGDFNVWRIYDSYADTANGNEGWFYDGGSTVVQTTGAPAFLRVGVNKWKVALKDKIIIPAEYQDFANTTWFSNICAYFDQSVAQMTVLLGDDDYTFVYNENSSNCKPSLILCTKAEVKDVVIAEETPAEDAPATADFVSLAVIVSVLSLGTAIIVKKH